MRLWQSSSSRAAGAGVRGEVMRYFAMLLVAITLVLGGACAGQTVSILPNAMTTFVDGNGVPYAGGHVYMYVPYTTTPKATYQTPLGTSANSNPITLDANGRAVIWGSGEYRQILQDAFGVVVWDQLTYAAPVSGASTAGAIWYGTATGTANAITLGTSAGFVGTDGQQIGFIASATNTSSTTVNASGYGSVLLEKNGTTGPVVLVGGEVAQGNLVYATYSAGVNAFVLQNSLPPLPPPGIGVQTGIASAATTDLGTVASHNASVTGTTTISSFGSSATLAWPIYLVQFQGALTLTQSAGLVTPSGVNITTAAGDSAWVEYLGSGTWQVLSYNSATPSQVTVASGLRLSTSSSSPISPPSNTGTATVYAVPYAGNVVPLWNGVTFVPTACGALSNVLANSTAGNAGPAAAVVSSVYDLVVWNNAGTCTLTRDVAWTNVTTPAAGDAFGRVNGVLVNSVAITNGPAAGFGTYLGTIATDAAGVTVTFNPTPAAASGGPTGGAWVGLWNQYNRLQIGAFAQDNKATWAYTTATWRQADGSTNNKITFVTGQAEDAVSVAYFVGANGQQSGVNPEAGIALDAVGVPLISAMSAVASASTSIVNTVSVCYPGEPLLGQHAYLAEEYNGNGTGAYYGLTLSSGAVSMQLSAQLRY